MSEPKKKSIPNVLKFVFGGTAGMMGTCVVHPLDVIKNRMQMSGEGSKVKEHKSSLHVLLNIVSKEGPKTLYTGLTAGLLRQATYTTTRLGIYTWLYDLFTTNNVPPNFAVKAGLGMFAGVCGAFVGTPAEVALIRMTLDGRLPPAQRRNYKNVAHALIRILQEEGIQTWWKGALPTMGRAMVVNAAQLATYSQAKGMLLATGNFKDGIFLHFCASMISGFITTVASLPVDIVKTRIQNSKSESGRKAPGFSEVIGKIIGNEGVFALWKGFWPYYFRLGPHTVLMFIFLEQLQKAYYRLSKQD